jgi:hypothetical protein
VRRELSGALETRAPGQRMNSMAKFLLWLLLFLLCWPVALAALVLYPAVWLLLLPFRILGVAVEGVLAFVRALFRLPARVLGERS